MSTEAVLPTVAPSPVGWMGSDLMADPGQWTRQWSQGELDDLFVLAQRYLSGDLTNIADLADASPQLRALAEDVRSDLITGRGFTLLKGYPIGQVSRRLEAVGFLIFGRLLGTLRSQNAAGHLLGHVKDVGGDAGDPAIRIYQTNERQTFHTDSTDAVGLLCRTTAVSGGRSQLASAETAFRIMVARRPDLAALLFEPIATDRRGEIPDGADPWFEIPVLSWFADRLTVIYQRTYIDSAARFADAPKPSPAQVEALDLWDEIVNEPGVHLTMDLEPGDMQFVYNHSLLHDRTGFVDHLDPELRRHLLRLWVSLPGDRRLPPIFEQRYGDLTPGHRGGIVLADTKLSVPFDVDDGNGAAD